MEKNFLQETNGFLEANGKTLENATCIEVAGIPISKAMFIGKANHRYESDLAGHINDFIPTMRQNVVIKGSRWTMFRTWVQKNIGKGRPVYIFEETWEFVELEVRQANFIRKLELDGPIQNF